MTWRANFCMFIYGCHSNRKTLGGLKGSKVGCFLTGLMFYVVICPSERDVYSALFFSFRTAPPLLEAVAKDPPTPGCGIAQF